MHRIRSTLLLAATFAYACKSAPATPPEPAAEPPPPSPVEPAPTDEPAPTTTTPPPAEPTPPSAIGWFDHVFAVHIDERKEWSVNMIDFAGADITALERRLEKLPEGTPVEDFKSGDPSLPAGFAVGDPWTVVSPAGVEQRAATGFYAALSSSGALHFHVRLGRPNKGAKGRVLAVRGQTVAPSARLILPPSIRASTVGKTTLTDAVQAIVPHLEPEIQAVVPQIKFTDTNLKLYPGRFPGGRSHVGFLVARAPGEDNELLPVSGIVFVRPDGRVEFFATAVTWGTASLLALVDLDGDGLDEILHDDTYFEGGYIQLIHWKDGRPLARTLTGDGV